VTDIALVFDGGPGNGMGHRRRMQALAASLEVLGARPRLVPTDEWHERAPVVVVDSYEQRADDQDRFPRPAGARVVAVDDLERDLAVDLLVDPNPGSDPATTGAAAKVLLGPRYALINRAPGVAAAPAAAGPVRSVLVTMGAADQTHLADAIAADLAAALPEVEVRLVLVDPDAAPPSGVTAIVAPDGLFDALRAADIVVTAGGVTLLEAMLVGRPVIALATAANQERSVRGSGAAGAAVALGLGTDRDAVAAAVVALVSDEGRRAELTRAASAYVDGLGADRVAEAILAL
jgi:UDP-2,4-diacetamido-2,4,6-trideoxy-beta-L-altropyranose hydrolase